jgi:histone H3/H4
MTSGELISALSCKIECILDKAIERAKANGRKTVNPHDL